MQAIALFGYLKDNVKNLTIDNLIEEYNLLKKEQLLTKIESPNIHGEDIMNEKVEINLENIKKSNHDINIIDKESHLYDIYGNNINGISMHKYAINKYGSDFKVTAYAPDLVPEAIEYKNKNYFILGVQFHPELEKNKIFKKLIDEARKRK